MSIENHKCGDIDPLDDSKQPLTSAERMHQRHFLAEKIGRLLAHAWLKNRNDQIGSGRKGAAKECQN